MQSDAGTHQLAMLQTIGVGLVGFVGLVGLVGLVGPVVVVVSHCSASIQLLSFRAMLRVGLHEHQHTPYYNLHMPCGVCACYTKVCA